jgi:hypothetical protein
MKTYMNAIMAGATLEVELANGNAGFVKLARDYHADGEHSIVFEIWRGWAADMCGEGFTEAICQPGSKFLDESFLVGAQVSICELLEEI